MRVLNILIIAFLVSGLMAVIKGNIDYRKADNRASTSRAIRYCIAGGGCCFIAALMSVIKLAVKYLL